MVRFIKMTDRFLSVILIMEKPMARVFSYSLMDHTSMESSITTCSKRENTVHKISNTRENSKTMFSMDKDTNLITNRNLNSEEDSNKVERFRELWNGKTTKFSTHTKVHSHKLDSFQMEVYFRINSGKLTEESMGFYQGE